MVGQSTFRSAPSALIRGPRTFDSGTGGRRGLVALLILAAHAGVIFLVALSMRVTPGRQEAPPVTVMIETPAVKLDRPITPEPKLVPITQPVSDVPDVPVEVEVPTGIRSELQISPAPAPVALAKSDDSMELRSMSEVAYLEPPAPRYPPESKRAREEGLVILRVLIDESGHASRVNVFRSSGHPRLDEAACNAVQRALFKPYVDGGIAHAAIAMVPVEFSLHGGGV
jgi:protein TonB